jgi:hypothetical protein
MIVRKGNDLLDAYLQFVRSDCLGIWYSSVFPFLAVYSYLVVTSWVGSSSSAETLLMRRAAIILLNDYRFLRRAGMSRRRAMILVLVP